MPPPRSRLPASDKYSVMAFTIDCLQLIHLSDCNPNLLDPKDAQPTPKWVCAIFACDWKASQSGRHARAGRTAVSGVLSYTKYGPSFCRIL